MSLSSKLRDKELFSYLRPDQIEQISDASEVVSRQKGEYVYEQGKHAQFCYIVLKGSVELSYPIKDDVSVKIDQIQERGLFGSIAYQEITSYHLNAKCSEDSDLLRIDSKILKVLMDEDPVMGYAIQSRISAIYFLRYIHAMKNLKSLVMDIT